MKVCICCFQAATGEVVLFSEDLPYCDKHKQDIHIAADMLDEDPKAIDKLIKKFRCKNDKAGSKAKKKKPEESY